MIYKNYIKQKARELIWERAIKLLTENREKSTLIYPKIMYYYWEHIISKYSNILKFDLSKLTESSLESFLKVRESKISSKSSKELKVLYLCGPEPENDIECLLNLGVIPENIWAIEKDPEIFKYAYSSIKYLYPNIKILQEKIENILSTLRTKFDIIYLDFTAPFFSKRQKPFRALHQILIQNSLEDLSVLITNFSELDKKEEYINLLTHYFYHQNLIESGIIEITEGEITEGPITYGLETDHFRKLIHDNLERAYSAFLTHYPIYFSCRILPAINIFSNKSLFKLLIDKNAYKKAIKKISNISYINATCAKNLDLTGGEKFLQPENFWFEFFIDEIEKIEDLNFWRSQFSQKISEKGLYISIKEAVSIINLIRMFVEGYHDVINSQIRKRILETQENVLGQYVFCDIAFPHLWIELIINQLGHPYHANIEKHFRFSYRAKERKMFVDMFLFDKCRYFYDWIPTVFLLPEMMLDVEKQLVTRIVIDIISKHYRYVLPEVFWGAALIGMNEKQWANFKTLSKREFLSISVKGNNIYNDQIYFLEILKLAKTQAIRVRDIMQNKVKIFKDLGEKHTWFGSAWIKIIDKNNPYGKFGILFRKLKIKDEVGWEYDSKTGFLRICNFYDGHEFLVYKAAYETACSILQRAGIKCKLIEILD